MSAEAFKGSLAGRLACARSYWLHRDGLWGCGQGHSCLLHLPQQIWPERAHLFKPHEKTLTQKKRIFPKLPFLWLIHTVHDLWVESPLFSPALLGAAPAARWRCCRAQEPFHPPNSCLRFAWALLRAAAPSQVTAHRFSCAIDTPDTPRLERMVSEHCHPTPIVINHVSRPHRVGYLLVAGNPPPFSTDAGSHPTHGRHALCVTADSSRGWLGHGAST